MRKRKDPTAIPTNKCCTCNGLNGMMIMMMAGYRYRLAH